MVETLITDALLPANTAVPMLLSVNVRTPAIMLIALVPIVLIEAAFIRAMAGRRWGAALADSAIMNVITTLVGIVCTLLFSWIVVPLWVRFAESASFMELPLESRLDTRHLAVTSAAILFHIPMFFLSWWMESRVLKDRWKHAEAPACLASRVSLAANATTYTALVLLWASQLMWPWFDSIRL